MASKKSIRPAPKIKNKVVLGYVLRAPLGSSGFAVALPNQTIIKIYVPTKLGGKLSLKPSKGKVLLCYDGGRNLDKALTKAVWKAQHKVVGPGPTIDYDVPKDKHGWYFVRILDTADASTLDNTFVQAAIAKDSDGTDLVPWNFWYFPYSKFSPTPRGWSDPGAYKRFEAKFGSGGFAWEYANHRVPDATDDASHGWEGHCHGAVRAAIFFRQPEVPTPNPQGFTQEDLELFATEYAQSNCNRVVEWGLPGDRGSALHSEVPSKGPGLLNEHAGEFHEHVYDVIAEKQDACYMDLRAKPPGTAEQVWNQSVYKFSATFKEHPDAAGNEKDILIENTLTANVDDNGVNNANPETGRSLVRIATYRLIFKADGGIDHTNAKQDWEAMKTAGVDQYAPRYIMRPINFSTSLADGNPQVTFARLNLLGIRRRKKYEALSTP
jgi:hypothetical protein